MYHYESLDEKKFQTLCQAILSSEIPNVQCLPTGQPDGGRDAFQRTIRRVGAQIEEDLSVFQVKFSLEPNSKNERDVISDLMKSESQKIKTLIEKGLSTYYLMTNVKGTSHLEVGSIDRVNRILTDQFGIDCFCYWRDDLDSRINGNQSLKWGFPEILKATDLLPELYRNCFGDSNERRLKSINAYLAHQHKYDAKLKFKQVDLDKGLVDLFVDVPAVALEPVDISSKEKWGQRWSRHPVLQRLSGARRTHAGDAEGAIGAVEALIEPIISETTPWIVIEGAPGQGKSTVVQYLCQLHRMRLLAKNWELSKVPPALVPTNVKLPLKVDIRDYATWINGASSFDYTKATQEKPKSVSLESFLAAQISENSGGTEFTTDDLLAFSSTSSLLIVLDGFDEVADISTRNKLVSEISDAGARLQGNSIAAQFIVTSRPAAFANSPGFPQEDWQYIKIIPLSKGEIRAYADKWTGAQSLETKEKHEILSVLEEKLDFPHVRDLARNPMQLAILLALISTQGASLPDKRTALYDRYVDIFFNRESEKSRIVRDNRDLLVGIHRYLAWVLQVEAEENGQAGNISEKRLRELVSKYLSDLGHETNIVDALFQGMVERVVALVSRVQGTFEFEVQPLREYFAARHLYDTAPYVPVGSDRSGSIMDRFNALAGNSYWLNVTRFYCGCYSTGELASLVDGIFAIESSDKLRSYSLLNELCFTLLNDYVFSQQPKLVERLVDFILSEQRFRLLLAQVYEDRGGQTIELPEGSGRAKLAEMSSLAYVKARTYDSAYAAGSLFRRNADASKTLELWNQSKKNFDPSQLALFAHYLGLFDQITPEQFSEIKAVDEAQAISMAVYRGREDLINFDAEDWERFVGLALDGDAGWYGITRLSGIEDEVRPAEIIQLVLGIVESMADTNSEFLADLSRDHHNLHRFGHRKKRGWLSANLDDVVPFGSEIAEFAISLFTADDWDDPRTLQLAENLVISLSERYGSRVTLTEAEIGLARELFRRGLSSNSERLQKFQLMLEHSSDQFWWVGAFSGREVSIDRLSLIEGFLAFTSSEMILALQAQVSDALENLSHSEYKALNSYIAGDYRPYLRSSEARFEGISDGVDPEKVGPRWASLLWKTVPDAEQAALFQIGLFDYDNSDRIFEQGRVSAALQYANLDKSFWPKAIEIVRVNYEKNQIPLHVPNWSRNQQLPSEMAYEILDDTESFPLSLIQQADSEISELAGEKTVAVGTVADEQKWFAESLV